MFVNFLEKFKKVSENASGRSKKDISAQSAYSVAKYGVVLSDEKMISWYLDRIDDLIRKKSIDCQFCAAFDVDNDMRDLIPKIMSHYKDKGFYVKLISEENEEELVGSYVFLSWKRKLKANDTNINI